MLCENCGKNQANVKYTQIINGDKREMNLCEECSQKLGLTNMDFSIPMDFSSFFGDFLKEFENNTFLPEFSDRENLKCKNCNLTFEEFMNTGKMGCSYCYDAFKSEIDPILKKIHGSNRHIGRLGTIKENVKLNEIEKEQNNKEKVDDEVVQLKEKLKKAILEENYEYAAELRDEIKKKEK